ncbi:MAG: hypothetical protein HY870_06735 [Chloroflexi bacterium]|nr:hypothetical protein [Chloroflexota bacterium]
MKTRLIGFTIVMMIGLILSAPPVTAQSGPPIPIATATPDPIQLDQTATQLQVAANAALANAQAAVADAQSAANAAAQAKITAAEARQRANALEAQAATEKALLAERQADDATQTARRAVESATVALQRASEAVHQSALAQSERARLRVELNSTLNQIAALQGQLSDQQTIVGRQAMQLTLDRQTNDQHINDLRQAIVWLGLIGSAVCAIALLQARRLNHQRDVPTATPTSSITIDHETTETVPDPLIATLSPEMREHIERVLHAAQ